MEKCERTFFFLVIEFPFVSRGRAPIGEKLIGHQAVNELQLEKKCYARLSQTILRNLIRHSVSHKFMNPSPFIIRKTRYSPSVNSPENSVLVAKTQAIVKGKPCQQMGAFETEIGSEQ